MKFPSPPAARLAALRRLKAAVVSALLVVATSPAFAGFQRITDIFDEVNGWLIAAGVSIMTMAILWVGWKITFRGANFEDMSKPLIGGIVLGTAPVLAGLLMN